MRTILAAALLAPTLTACVEQLVTPEGCPIYYDDIMRHHTEACVAAYRRERARQAGVPVTECTPNGRGGMICVTQ
ncbi:hypothetical protein JANAI62_03900 [Jannaschia pagri]|uniref:Lipoprotein n=1 Tax=Jannaschia pagri TaxID=2829797 RepID=A0ABQ4NH83_9RHOB|nr:MULTISPECIES: hypothetical protein [unclassified Jannaschia]GIT90127.1 hypothetical protein JANAI61_05850 [Jannaschia sp. AI_61]GIT93767.1 hypothetical protein JANAI62_03900 [Jannaschia sp. AI_62]